VSDLAGHPLVRQSVGGAGLADAVDRAHGGIAGRRTRRQARVPSLCLTIGRAGAANRGRLGRTARCGPGNLTGRETSTGTG
jgi:hypothetical protein